MNQYRLIFILFIGLITTTAFAQNQISGKLSDHDTREALPYATVRLLQQDSTFVAGTVTDSLGHYRISDIKNYCCPINSIKYKNAVVGHCVFSGRVLFYSSKLPQKIDNW